MKLFIIKEGHNFCLSIIAQIKFVVKIHTVKRGFLVNDLVLSVKIYPLRTGIIAAKNMACLP